MLGYGLKSVQSKRSLVVAILFLCFGEIASSNSKLAPTVRLNSGYDIPVVGLGTARAKSEQGEQAVKDAIDAGYRHIDSAYLYGNEKEVGNAIRAKIDEGVIKREDIFVTTKLWGTFHEPDQVPKAFQKSFDNLNLTYIDLYLMHSPIALAIVNKNGSNTPPKDIDDVELFPQTADGKANTIDVDYVDTWRAMEELVKSNRVRSIGVSNFNSEQLERLLREGTIKPVTNQVECHPNLNQLKLLKFCADRNITLTAYSPLGRPLAGNAEKNVNLAINDPKVKALAEKYNKNPAQIILRFTHQNGAIVIPKSTNKERIKSNIDIFDFELDEDDVEILKELNTNYRIYPSNDAAHDKNYPFNIEF